MTQSSVACPRWDLLSSTSLPRNRWNDWSTLTEISNCVLSSVTIGYNISLEGRLSLIILQFSQSCSACRFLGTRHHQRLIKSITKLHYNVHYILHNFSEHLFTNICHYWNHRTPNVIETAKLNNGKVTCLAIVRKREPIIFLSN